MIMSKKSLKKNHIILRRISKKKEAVPTKFWCKVGKSESNQTFDDFHNEQGKQPEKEKIVIGFKTQHRILYL